MTTSIGIDIGGSAVKAVVRDDDRTITTEVVPRTEADPVEAVTTMIERLDEGGERPVGIGIAGLVDHGHGTYLWGPHLPWIDLELGKEVSSATGRRVLVDNDANVAALAEARIGAAADVDNSITVMLGSGIGLGIISGGQVLRGSGLAGEAGHIRMLLDGIPCHCGSDGCWETVVSGAVLTAAAVRLAESEPGFFPPENLKKGGATALAAAETAGSTAAGEVLDQTGRWLGRGVATLIDILSPSVVVVGGGLGDVTRRLIGPAREVITGIDRYRYRTTVEIRPSEFGEFAGATGAALQMME